MFDGLVQALFGGLFRLALRQAAEEDFRQQAVRVHLVGVDFQDRFGLADGVSHAGDA